MKLDQNSIHYQIRKLQEVIEFQQKYGKNMQKFYSTFYSSIVKKIVNISGEWSSDQQVGKDQLFSYQRMYT